MVIMPASGSRYDGTALALQGGGSHGAFTWGVLDALFEFGVKPDAVSGVSSRAILAAMAAQGFARDGQDGARSAMAKFWNRVAATDWLTPITKAFGHWLPGFEIGRNVSNTIAMQGLSAMTSMFGPLSLNPLGQNPLRPTLADLLNQPALCDPAAPTLYIAATAVETDRPRTFSNAEITIDALLASACLPPIFPAVIIDGVACLDGAYSGNPPLAPLIARQPKRLILVRAQSRQRVGVPEKPAEIHNRIQELAVQTAVEAELSILPAQTHLIEYNADTALADLPPASRLNTEKAFLDRLFLAGRAAHRAAEAA
jgi:NTE family protein